MEYVVDLDSFHGPLDLLLYLLDENQIDITDIPIAQITDQYMEYLNITGDFDLEKLGDFLIMASYLLTLKSQMLLPRNKEDEAENDADEIDPSSELVERLLDYKRFKTAAEELERLKDGEEKRKFYRQAAEDIFLRHELTANSAVLVKIFLGLWEKNRQKPFFTVPQDDIDIGEKMQEITGLLRNKRQGVLFQELFGHVFSKKELSALFMALLELIRLQKVYAEQEKEFGIIRLFPGRGKKC